MNVLAEFKKVTTFIFDIDGVLTDGTLLVLRDGLQARQMHVKDGFGLQMAMKHGYHVLIISGGVSEECRKRLEYLGLKDIHLGVSDKTKFVSDLLDKNKIKWEQVLFMGDDLPDIPVMHKVGLSACPADAVNEVKSIVKYVSPVNGGWGCVRDVIEKVLKVNGHWKYETDVMSK
ncbi:MAG TPA: HAD-IIIA family hydrolase [Chitinophagaceae bacterium]|nr:HAD-IIIA family hydrolase [Chitinophagaceae bacterium]